MSKLDDLINKLCPDGVEYKTLGELGEFYGGLSGKSKNDFIDGNSKFITYMNVYKNIKLDLDVSEKVKIAPNENQRTLEYGDVLFTGSSETPDECGISSVLADRTDEKLYLNSFCICYRFTDKELFNPEFSKYLFRSEELRKQIGKTASGVTRFNVSKEKMKKVVVPIVPLQVQNEIVLILDKFTSLEAELEAELEARRKQYEYYRDELLTFGDDVEWKTLADIVSQDCSISYGIVQPGDGVTNGIPVVRPVDMTSKIVHREGLKQTTKEISDSYKRTILKGDELLICVRGTTGIISFAGKDLIDCNVTRGIVPLSFNENIDSSYMFHILKSTEIQNKIEEKTNGAGLRQINMKDLRELKIPIPSLKNQKKIGNILDRFESLCNDITTGLPAEIEARHKQYEYYRDKLLTFKRKEA